MNGKPIFFVGLMAALLTLAGWILLRLRASRDISLPLRVRVG